MKKTIPLYPVILRTIPLLFGLGAILSPNLAQADDSELWLEVGGRYKVNKALRLDLALNLRFDEDVSRLQGLLPQLDISYRPLSWLRLGGGYRLVYRRSGDGFELGHRVHLDGKSLLKLADFRLSYRLRLQNGWDPQKDGEVENETRLRNLIGLSYRGWDWGRPSLSAEHFINLDQLDSQPTHKSRLTAGIAFTANFLKIEPFYRLEIMGDDSELIHIGGLNLRANYAP